jgi:hypothetical protein
VFEAARIYARQLLLSTQSPHLSVRPKTQSAPRKPRKPKAESRKPMRPHLLWAERMFVKRLAIFLDGTWNTLNNNTNVWRLKSLTVIRPAIFKSDPFTTRQINSLARRSASGPQAD